MLLRLTMSPFDIAVVGGGPAGAWTACLLAARGARVAIVDGSHPREKPCGGGLSARALILLRPLGPSRPIPGVTIGHGNFSDGRADVDIELTPAGTSTPALLVASRRDLDLTLLEAARAAGAELVAERALGIERRDGGWTIRTAGGAVECGRLVGADGANSLVRRTVARPFPRAALSIASGYYVHGLSASHIDIVFTQSPAGYLWSFPRPDHLAVGVGAQADEATSAQLFEMAAAWIDQRVGPSRGALTRYSWPIPSLSEPTSSRRPRLATAGCSSATPPVSSIRSPARGSITHWLRRSWRPRASCRTTPPAGISKDYGTGSTTSCARPRG